MSLSGLLTWARVVVAVMMRRAARWRVVRMMVERAEADPCGMTARKARATATTKANTGVLHFVQDDDEKQATTGATASAKAEADPYGITARKAKATTRARRRGGTGCGRWIRESRCGLAFPSGGW